MADSKDQSLSFYHDVEPWSPPKYCYPTWDDIMRFYMSRMQNKVAQSSEIVHELSMLVHEIWESGDGLPKHETNIAAQFRTEVLSIYKKYRKGEGRMKKSHQRKTPLVPTEPSRKSRRLNTNIDDVPNVKASDCAEKERTDDTTCKSSQLRLRKKSFDMDSNINYQHWLEDHGKKLFDVFSKTRLDAIITEKKTGTFDSEFYDDQKNPEKRSKIIKTMRVTQAYYEEQKLLELKKARKFARYLSATGSSVDTSAHYEDPDFSINEDELQTDTSTDFSPRSTSSISYPSLLASPVLRNSTATTSLKTYANTGTQTEYHTLDDENTKALLFSTRLKHTKAESFSTLIHPKYLQSGALMMSLNTMSSNQAIMAMYIHDTEVYNQERVLPLSLQKKYQQQLKLLKKLQAKEPEVNIDENIVELIDEVDEEEHDQIIINEIDIEGATETDGRVQASSSSLDAHTLEAKLMQKKTEHKQNLHKVLPEPRSLRRAHHNIATFLEGKVGEEMLRSGKTFLMPDGTSRQKLGRMGASLVSIDGKMRSLKMQWMGNEKRENWADTIIYQLRRLAVASGGEIDDIFKTIISIISDACKVNKGLGALISSKLGLSWIPGALYCCIHTVLGFQDGIKDVWMRYQDAIGNKKMYPMVTGFEMDMEDSCLVKQILEAFLRLTADRWQARSWNKHEEFNKFCIQLNIMNKARELHGNRFGDLELCSAIGVYSIPAWTKFIESHPNIRNQLSIFLRDTLHLSDICKVLWLGAALFGIHVTFPYIHMLLELQVTHTQLLDILPLMHSQLIEYPKSLAQMTEPGIDALSFAWLDPFKDVSSPYGKEICNGLLAALQTCDICLLDKYMKELCYKEGSILKRQRGNAYGFGDDPDSEEHVSKQMSTKDLEHAPTHTKAIENLYGTEDMILTRFGPQAFKKSQDDIIIKYSADLLKGDHTWATKRMRNITKKLDTLQDEFTQKQKDLMNAGVTPAEAIQLTTENKVQRVVEQCRRSHSGPISCETELDEMLEKLSDENIKRKALIFEIRYRKFTVLSIKESNPLFLQKNLTCEKLESNLRLLLSKSGLNLASSVTMDDLERAILQSSCDDTYPSNNEQYNEAGNEVQNKVETPPKIHEFASNSEGTSSSTSFSAILWPPSNGDHLVVNFENGFLIGEVLELNDDNENLVRISFMRPKNIATAEAMMHPRQFWVWGAIKISWVNRESIVPIYPVLNVTTPPSTRRCILFTLENLDIVEKLASL